MLIPTDSAFFARVAGLDFTGRAFDHEPGYYVTATEGLLLGGTTSYESIPSGTGRGDGEADVENVRTSPRIVTLTGFAYARTMWDLGQRIHRLAAALAEPDEAGWFKWREFGEQYRAWVRRGKDSPARRLGSTGRAEFTIRFRAPSQRIIGQKHPRVGPAQSIVLKNRGSYHALPVLRVTGDLPAGYRLTDGRGEYVVTQSLAPGQTHKVDMRDRILFRGGAAQPGAVSRPGLLAVPKFGKTTITLIPNAGSGQVSGENTDNYI